MHYAKINTSNLLKFRIESLSNKFDIITWMKVILNHHEFKTIWENERREQVKIVQFKKLEMRKA